MSSSRTGNFITKYGISNLIRSWSSAEKAKISTWILDKNLSGECPAIDLPQIDEIRNSKPLTISEKIDRFLRMLDKEGYRPGGRLPWHPTASQSDELLEPIHRIMLWTEAESYEEFYAFRDVLMQAGIIVKNHWCQLAYNGFRRMEQLRSVNAESVQAFVAMWFSEETASAFRDGIRLAIMDAGFEPLRIDSKEHNNKIDDEIIAEIKRSKFVVADFTCGISQCEGSKVAIVRGGVYYEAGFAQGLGIPVIWTVRADQMSEVHFDTRQYNHITWHDPAELREKLRNRIAAVIGRRQQ